LDGQKISINHKNIKIEKIKYGKTKNEHLNKKLLKSKILPP
jgi:hypothetical protein